MRALFAIFLFAASFLFPLCGQMASSAAMTQPTEISAQLDDDPFDDTVPSAHADFAPDLGSCDGDAPCIGIFTRQSRPSARLQERLRPIPSTLPSSAQIATDPHPPRNLLRP